MKGFREGSSPWTELYEGRVLVLPEAPHAWLPLWCVQTIWVKLSWILDLPLLAGDPVLFGGG